MSEAAFEAKQAAEESKLASDKLKKLKSKATVVLIQFSSFISYSNTEEPFRLESLNDTPLLSTEWPLFILKKSDYIEWLISQNYK